MDIISEKRNPSERINLVTIIKIIDCNWYSHSACDNPYIQISINGLVLDGTKDTMHANIQDSAEYDDFIKVDELMSLYTPGSLHWVESHAFHLAEGEVCFYRADTRPVNAEDLEVINKLFTIVKPQKRPEPLIITTSNIDRDMDKLTVVMSGCLEHVNTSCTKRGRKMTTAKLHDQNGNIDLVIFPNVYEDYEKILLQKGKINVTGRLDVSENSSYLIPERFELSVR